MKDKQTIVSLNFLQLHRNTLPIRGYQLKSISSDGIKKVQKNAAFAQKIINRYGAAQFYDFDSAMLTLLEKILDAAKEEKLRGQERKNIIYYTNYIKNYEKFKAEILCSQNVFYNQLIQHVNRSLTNLNAMGGVPAAVGANHSFFDIANQGNCFTMIKKIMLQLITIRQKHNMPRGKELLKRDFQKQELTYKIHMLIEREQLQTLYQKELDEIQRTEYRQLSMERLQRIEKKLLVQLYEKKEQEFLQYLKQVEHLKKIEISEEERNRINSAMHQYFEALMEQTKINSRSVTEETRQELQRELITAEFISKRQQEIWNEYQKNINVNRISELLEHTISDKQKRAALKISFEEIYMENHQESKTTREMKEMQDVLISDYRQLHSEINFLEEKETELHQQSMERVQQIEKKLLVQLYEKKEQEFLQYLKQVEHLKKIEISEEERNRINSAMHQYFEALMEQTKINSRSVTEETRQELQRELITAEFISERQQEIWNEYQKNINVNRISELLEHTITDKQKRAALKISFEEIYMENHQESKTIQEMKEMQDVLISDYRQLHSEMLLKRLYEKKEQELLKYLNEIKVSLEINSLDKKETEVSKEMKFPETELGHISQVLRKYFKTLMEQTKNENTTEIITQEEVWREYQKNVNIHRIWEVMESTISEESKKVQYKTILEKLYHKDSHSVQEKQLSEYRHLQTERLQMIEKRLLTQLYENKEQEILKYFKQTENLKGTKISEQEEEYISRALHQYFETLIKKINVWSLEEQIKHNVQQESSISEFVSARGQEIWKEYQINTEIHRVLAGLEKIIPGEQQKIWNQAVRENIYQQEQQNIQKMFYEEYQNRAEKVLLTEMKVAERQFLMQMYEKRKSEIKKSLNELSVFPKEHDSEIVYQYFDDLVSRTRNQIWKETFQNTFQSERLDLQYTKNRQKQLWSEYQEHQKIQQIRTKKILETMYCKNAQKLEENLIEQETNSSYQRKKVEQTHVELAKERVNQMVREIIPDSKTANEIFYLNKKNSISQELLSVQEEQMKSLKNKLFVQEKKVEELVTIQQTLLKEKKEAKLDLEQITDEMIKKMRRQLRLERIRHGE